MNQVFGILLITIFVLSIGMVPAHAQMNTTQDPITFTLNPQYPQPYSVFTITPDSTLVDLTASTITVKENGVVIATGSGSITAQGTVGGPGTKSVIDITVAGGGQSYQKELVIQPGDVALVTEPASIAHFLYEGAPLVGAETRVRLVALADLETAPGKAIPSSQLIYTWKFGDKLLESDSGLGKSVLNAIAPVRYRDADITVTVTNQDNSIVAQAQTTISPVDPYIRIYQNDPLLGPEFNQALPSEVTMTSSETTFRAVPYYFSALPTIAWTVNDAQSGADQDLTVRSTGNGKGIAVVSVHAEKNDQSADSSLGVHFGESKSLGIFGL